MRLGGVRGLVGVVIASAALCGAVLLAGVPARANSGVVVLDGACFLLDGNGVIVSGPRSGGETAFSTLDDGTVEARCRATVAPALDGGVREWSYEHTGKDCTVLIDGRLTRTIDWRQTVDDQGAAELICRATP